MAMVIPTGFSALQMADTPNQHFTTVTASVIILTNFAFDGESPAVSMTQELCSLNDHGLHHHWVKSIRKKSSRK